MFEKLKSAIEEKKKEQKQLNEYEKQLKIKAMQREKQLAIEKKKKDLKEKYKKLEVKYSKTNEQKRKETSDKLKKIYSEFNSTKKDNGWATLGSWSEKATKTLEGNNFGYQQLTPKRYGVKKQKVKSNPYLDKFLKGDFK